MQGLPFNLEYSQAQLEMSELRRCGREQSQQDMQPVEAAPPISF